MPTEKQLLNTLFDDATSDTEKAAAVAALKKIIGKDRAGLGLCAISLTKGQQAIRELARAMTDRTGFANGAIRSLA